MGGGVVAVAVAVGGGVVAVAVAVGGGVVAVAVAVGGGVVAVAVAVGVAVGVTVSVAVAVAVGVKVAVAVGVTVCAVAVRVRVKAENTHIPKNRPVPNLLARFTVSDLSDVMGDLRRSSILGRSAHACQLLFPSIFYLGSAPGPPSNRPAIALAFYELFHGEVHSKRISLVGCYHVPKVRFTEKRKFLSEASAISRVTIVCATG